MVSKHFPCPGRGVGEAAAAHSPSQRFQPSQGCSMGSGPRYAQSPCRAASQRTGWSLSSNHSFLRQRESDRPGAGVNNDGSPGEAKQNMQLNPTESVPLGH